MRAGADVAATSSEVDAGVDASVDAGVEAGAGVSAGAGSEVPAAVGFLESSSSS